MGKLEMVIDKIIRRFITDSIPEASWYILPNGDILDLGHDGHNYILELLSIENIEKYSEVAYSNKLRAMNWIRGNQYWEYIDLCETNPTNEQYKQLIKLIDAMNAQVEITSPKGHSIQYTERTTDEIIKLIKRYYTSGNLLEKIV